MTVYEHFGGKFGEALDKIRKHNYQLNTLMICADPDYGYDLLVALKEAKKEFPIKKSPVFTDENIVDVLIWYEKWFGSEVI